MEKLPNVLLIEDDPNLGIVIQEFLQAKGFEVDLCTDGDEGLSTALKQNYDMCIIDVMLPKKDGFELAASVRAARQDLPIIFVTARDKIEDKQRGYAAGGDDYLTKPFSMEELTLRINAVLRRYRNYVFDKDQVEKFTIGNYVFDYGIRTLNGPDESAQKLSTKEAELLKLLCHHCNKVLSRELALKMIWGDDNYYTARSMDVFITKLRKYLKADPRIEIMNVHGTGYKLIIPS
jgi:DNA-binding response OmpR family regulator